MNIKHSLVAAVVVMAIAAAPVMAGHESDVYISWNVYDNTATDGYYYYSYEIFATQPLTQTLSKWFLDIGNAPDWQEVAGSPAPSGTLPAAPSDNSTGYTNGYTWGPAAEVVLPPAENPTNLGRSLLWETTSIWGLDQDGDGVKEYYEPGVNNGYLSGYAGVGPPTDPGTAANTDVAMGWFQFRSTAPPQPTDYRIDNGVAEWFGRTEAPTPEPISLLLLLVGAPAAVLARRRSS